MVRHLVLLLALFVALVGSPRISITRTIDEITPTELDTAVRATLQVAEPLPANWVPEDSAPPVLRTHLFSRPALVTFELCRPTLQAPSRARWDKRDDIRRVCPSLSLSRAEPGWVMG